MTPALRLLLVRGGVIGGAALVLSAASCIPVGETNPRFATTPAQAYGEFDRMRADPTRLERPLLVIGSYRGPDFFVTPLARTLVALTSQDPGDIAVVPAWFDAQIPPVVARSIKTAGETFGYSEDRRETVEVDVVGISMGGVVARAAAIERDGAPRLKIRNLYTIASPHRGAVLARGFALDDAARDMRPGSDFIRSINANYEDRDYELIAYGVLRDGVVGVQNAAPPGEVPIWTRGKLWGSHLTVNENKPIIADIARRLRGEEPLSQPGEPLPSRN